MKLSTNSGLLFFKTVCFLVFLSISHSFAFAKNDDAARAKKASQQAITLRQQSVIRGYALLKEASQAYDAKEYSTALEKYRTIISLLPTPSPATAALQNQAYDGLAKTLLTLARQDIENEKLDDARAKAEEAISFAPDNPAVRAEYASIYAAMGIPLDKEGRPVVEDNPAVTPRHVKNVSDVMQLLAEGDDFLVTGQYDAAEKKYQQVLLLDRYNSTARKKMDEVLAKKQKYAEKAQESSREQAMADVELAWEMPIPGDVAVTDQNLQTSPISRSNAANIENKLKSIVVPDVSFEQATIYDIIAFLNAKSREYDPEKRGINFVPRLEESSGTEITLHLQNVSLYEVIRYATLVANLKFKIDEFTVTILPLTATTDQLLTKEYRVSPDFFTSLDTSAVDKTAARRSTRGTSRALQDKATVGGPANAKAILESKGVDFKTEGSSVYYSLASSKMIVKNTPDQLELIDALVGSPTEVSPQVEIEAKLIELNQNDLEEFSTAMNIVRQNNYTRAGGDLSHQNMDGLNHLDGLRSSRHLRANNIDTLLSENGAINAGAPMPNELNFTFTAGYTFDIMLRFLSQKKSVDLLSAPKVVARSGENATIRIVRRFFYATQYNPPELPPISQSGQATGREIAPPVVTPVQPANFEEKEIGVVLTVKPEVGPDNYTINLDLAPQVVDFEGFINYGQPLTVRIEDREFLLSENIVNMPIFNSRELKTSVQVYDGNTVVLGGLMREDVQKIDDKVPIIGDIPLLGRLFRSKVDQSIKKNLIIFVTPRLVTSSGELLNPPEPLVLPTRQTVKR